jgi:DNA-binding response OmpR family regulator
MRKRVLVAEAADAIRGVVETVLRQNGLEVISVESPDKANEVLEFSRPDLLIVAADLRSSDDSPYFEKVQANPRATGIPMLLFAPADGADIAFPSEALIPQPFDPQQFLQKVTTFLGTESNRPNQSAGESFSDAEEEFLDVALGLDQLEVEASEEMNKSNTMRKKRRKSRSAGKDSDEDTDKGRRVESVIITEDDTDIRQVTHEKKSAEPAAESSKLEIMDDQFGISNPNAFKTDEEAERGHDYDWFINSMRAEATAAENAEGASEGVSQTIQDGSDELKFTDNASVVNPFTSVSGESSQTSTSKPKSGTPESTHSDSGKVEKFIDEFKKEMELLRSEEPDSVAIDDAAGTASGTGKQMDWEEKVERMTVREVAVFTKEFSSRLAEALAEKIAAKIDPEKLMHLIKKEVLSRKQQ